MRSASVHHESPESASEVLKVVDQVPTPQTKHVPFGAKETR